MKKVIFALFAGALILTSCEKDDEKNEKQPSELVIGNWNLDRVDIVSFENDVQVSTDTEVMDLQLRVTSNGFIVTSELDTIDEGTYTVSKTNLHIFGEDTINFQIKSLTETEMNLFAIDEYDDDSTQYRDEMTYYFEK